MCVGIVDSVMDASVTVKPHGHHKTYVLSFPSCVYVWVCVCVCVRVHMYMYVSVSVRACTLAHTRLYVCLCIPMCIYRHNVYQRDITVTISQLCREIFYR